MDSFNPASVSCVISARTDLKESEGTSSGVIIDSKKGLILSHASLLTPLLARNSKLIKSLRGTGVLRDGDILSKFKCTVYLPPNQQYTENTHRYRSMLTNSEIENDNSGIKKDNTVCVATHVCVLCVFECRSLKRILSKLIPSSEFEFADMRSDTPESEKVNPGLSYQLLSCFVLLKTSQNSSSYLPLRSALETRVGDRVEICSTPFGSLNPDVFLNSRSSGIISNLAGENNVLILTDARCIPGSEGAGLFTSSGNTTHSLTGMIIAPVCWKNNEWVGLALACSLSEVLKSLDDVWDYNFEHHTVPADILNEQITWEGCSCSVVSHAARCVPLVSVGNKWGSGVVVDRQLGLVLTCSHVIRGSEKSPVELYSVNQSKHPVSTVATVLYKTPSGGQFDLAVLSVECDWSGTHLNLCQEEVCEGDTVTVIGHALFPKNHSLGPMVTSGIISKIVKIGGTTVMLQTTCAVQAGASGGAVIDRQGRLVAIVVCNAKDDDTGASYPHVNMCVPVSAILPVLQDFITSRDPGVLRNLCVISPALRRLWTLGNTTWGTEEPPQSKL
ncbi:hypothetical protein ScPMuIL_015633 [Solemya velum]